MTDNEHDYRTVDKHEAIGARPAHDLGLCEHEVVPLPHSDEALPGHVWRLECPVCGVTAEWDAQDDQLTTDF